MRKIYSTIAALLITVLSVAINSDSVICHLSDVGGHYREHNVDFKKMKLEVSFEPQEGKVRGKVQYQFSPIQPLIDSVFLDALGMEIQKVLVDNKEVRFVKDSGGVNIFFAPALAWNTTHFLEIKYEATPRRGLYFIGWNDERNLSRKQIWTQGQGVDNRYWFPCYDDVNDKLVTETSITFNKNYTVVSNGKLLETKINADSTKTWHYAMTKPHSPYLVMIAIDKYAWKDVTSSNGIISRQYYYADHPEQAEPTYRYSQEMMDFLVKETGTPFPWETYSNTPVQDFMFGAMENTTATIYGDFYLLDKRAIIERPYIGTNAHELTHQWFGDYITEWSATHHWLHESFATYYSKQFLRKTYGEDYYQWAKRGEGVSAIAADKNDRYPVAHARAGSPRHYPKGSYVIDMLRYVVGDEVFKASIQYYLKKHGYDMVDTHDFYLAFMEKAGINLDWFFDEWIWRSGVPRYVISKNVEADKTTFYLSQTHKMDSLTLLFKMPLVFEVIYADGKMDSVRKMVTKANDTIVVWNKERKKIAYTLFDPASNVLKTVDFHKPLDEIIQQAMMATNMIDRYDAVATLKDTLFDGKFDLLQKIYANEKASAVKIKIVELAGKESNDISMLALKDADFLVRRAALENVDSISPNKLAAFETLLTDTSYITIESALKKLVRLFPENKARYLALTKSLSGISKNIRIAWLELQCKDSLDVYKNELVAYTSHSYEFRTRVKAMEAIGRLNYGDAAVMRNLFDAIINPNSRLAGPATSVANKLLKNEENKQLAKTYFETTEWKDWQKEILGKLF